MIWDRAQGLAELDGLFVELDVMRGGIGRALIADIVTGADRESAHALDVTANPRAVGFHETLGFRDRGPVRTRFGPGLRMRLTLGGAGGP